MHSDVFDVKANRTCSNHCALKGSTVTKQGYQDSKHCLPEIVVVLTLRLYQHFLFRYTPACMTFRSKVYESC
jgi:hypothetical protein